MPTAPALLTDDDLSSARGRVRAACARIEADPSAFDLQALAATACCSARQLQRDFDAVVGIGPRAYAQAIRTDAACQLARGIVVDWLVNNEGYTQAEAEEEVNNYADG